MITSVLIALQIASAQPFVIRAPDRTVRVPVVSTDQGPMLRPESLAEMLPIEVHRDADTAYSLEVWGARLRLRPGVPVVRVGDDVRPLAAAPRVQRGQLLVPLQLFTEVFPTVVPNTRWDTTTRQLVLFTSLSAARARAGELNTTPKAAANRAGATRPNSQGSASNRAVRRPRTDPAVHRRRMVIVDAGHGGVDRGMTGPIGRKHKIYEKNITLAVALQLGTELERRGVDVVYTRTTDTLIALDDRGRIANRAGGDLFISIHVNAANPRWKNPGSARGFETYFLSEARTEDARRVEQMENDAVRFESAPDSIDAGDPLSFILSDMTQNMHLRESSELAEDIQRRLAAMHPGPSRGVKQAGFRVLVTAYMPAVLVEIGFGTNPSEAAFISNPTKQKAIARAVADGAMQYLREYEARVGGGVASPQR